MSTVRLSEASHIVLGLVEACGTASPYDLKHLVEKSVANFWSVPHTQLYGECTRLAGAGLLDERQEETGRRRKTYTITAAGREALERWRGEAVTQLMEYRDLATLKLFFGADPERLAEAQLDAHEAKLAEYEGHVASEDLPAGMRLALEAGIGHEREFIRFWSDLLSRRSGP